MLFVLDGLKAVANGLLLTAWRSFFCWKFFAASSHFGQSQSLMLLWKAGRHVFAKDLFVQSLFSYTCSIHVCTCNYINQYILVWVQLKRIITRICAREKLLLTVNTSVTWDTLLCFFLTGIACVLSAQSLVKSVSSLFKPVQLASRSASSLSVLWRLTIAGI